jgi:hypothetical protein
LPRHRDAGSVGHAQIALAAARLGRSNFNLARGIAVIVQSLLFGDIHDVLRTYFESFFQIPARQVRIMGAAWAAPLEQ